MSVNFGFTKAGKCRICKSKGYTEVHHIISQAMCETMERPDLKNNQGNLVELCKACHDLTNHSYYRDNLLSEEEKRKNRSATHAKRRQRIGKHVCAGVTKKGRPCRKKVGSKGAFCPTHRPSRYADEDRCTHVNPKNHRRCRKQHLQGSEFCGPCLQRADTKRRKMADGVAKGIDYANRNESINAESEQ